MYSMEQLIVERVMGEGACAIGFATTETLEGGPESVDLEYALGFSCGGFDKIRFDAPGIRPECLFEMYYGSLVDYLAASHWVMLRVSTPLAAVSAASFPVQEGWL